MKNRIIDFLVERRKVNKAIAYMLVRDASFAVLTRVYCEIKKPKPSTKNIFDYFSGVKPSLIRKNQIA